MKTPRDPSPFGLIQEELRNRPWHMLIACMMLNLTNIKQVRPIIWSFFDHYPDPATASEADPAEMANMLRPLGLYNRRAKMIIRFSRAFQDEWDDVLKLPGIGKYAADSYKIFVMGSLDVMPTDSKLKKYKEWAVYR